MSDTTADTSAPLDPPSVDPTTVSVSAADVLAADLATNAATGVAAGEPAPVDLGAIERDLADVEAALPRLDDGSYWVDEITGDEIPDGVLAENPVARRA